jgi:hypothetical protein
MSTLAWIKRLVLLPTVLLLCLLAPAGASAVSPLHSISVYAEGGGEGESEVVAVFTTAKCVHKKSKSGSGPYFLAKAKSTDGQSELQVSIPEFTGFKTEYEVEPGEITPKPSVTFALGEGNSNHFYSSTYAPPVPVPTIGEIIFREAGHLMGVGYGPAMFDYHGASAVFFTGVVECEKAKKGKKGKA